MSNKRVLPKILYTILLILYIAYFLFIISWIKHLHSQISIYSISGIFIPFILFLCFSYGMFKAFKFANRKYIYISLLFIIIPVLFSFGQVLKNQMESKFDYTRWIEKLDKRVWMIDDLLDKYDMVNMHKDKIVELLGEPTVTEYFKENDNIVYWLGPERGLVRIDSEWLVIWFDDKDYVKEIKIMRD